MCGAFLILHCMSCDWMLVKFLTPLFIPADGGLLPYRFCLPLSQVIVEAKPLKVWLHDSCHFFTELLLRWAP